MLSVKALAGWGSAEGADFPEGPGYLQMFGRKLPGGRLRFCVPYACREVPRECVGRRGGTLFCATAGHVTGRSRQAGQGVAAA